MLGPLATEGRDLPRNRGPSQQRAIYILLHAAGPRNRGIVVIHVTMDHITHRAGTASLKREKQISCKAQAWCFGLHETTDRITHTGLERPLSKEKISFQAQAWNCGDSCNDGSYYTQGWNSLSNQQKQKSESSSRFKPGVGVIHVTTDRITHRAGTASLNREK